MAPGNCMYGLKARQALAANPAASALFVQQNAPDIASWIHAGDHGGGLPDDQVNDFLAVLKAGTVTIKATDPKLGGQTVTALVTAYGGNPGAHAPAQFEALYGQIVKDYWPDVVVALTAKASGSDPHGDLTSPDGISLSPDHWAPLIDLAMRDPQTGATLLKLAHAQGSQWFNLATQQTPGPDAGNS